MSLHDHGSDAQEHGALERVSLSASRRDFLKVAGFSVATAMVSGCGRGETHRAVPFLKKPETVTPGQSSYYATGCRGCDAGCGLLVKVRDGRPIKIEGNDLHPLNGGRTCAVGQASILGLYDSHRLTAPHMEKKPSNWKNVDAAIRSALATAKSSSGAVRLVTGSVQSPSLQAAIDGFLATTGNGKHIQVDGLSNAAIADAHEALYGTRTIPRYHFERATALVSLDADFLGTWLSPVEFARGYHAARSLEPGTSFCHHTQFESHMSLTGGNADRRFRVTPSELPLVAAALAEAVAKARGQRVPWGKAPKSSLADADLEAVAKRLLDAPAGRALVVCGSQDVTTQKITAYLNYTLGATAPAHRERTIDLSAPSRQALGDDRAFDELLGELRDGRVRVLIFAGANPVYTHPKGDELASLMERVPTIVSMSERMDETATHAHIVCPPPHFLSAWFDAEPVAGLFTLSQPTLASLGDTRQVMESLLAWSGRTVSGKAVSAYDHVRTVWRDQIHARAKTSDSFDAWWHQALHDGFATVKAGETGTPTFAQDAPIALSTAETGDGLALVTYEKIAIRDGRHAHNPWLQELPDPINKTSWQNTADVSPSTAAKLGIADGDVVRLTSGEHNVSLPALVQPGMADDTVAVALGYGVLGTHRFHDAGPDWIQATPTVEDGGTVGTRIVSLRGPVRVERTGNTVPLARTQIYDRLEVPKHLAPKGGETRPVYQSTTYDEFKVDPHAGAHHEHPIVDLWDEDHPYKGHHWELAIDLTSCTGCSACVVACQSENNIPVVGKDEMIRQREMHWLRIDRYFQGEDDDMRIAHQPMMCQQCDHAPCETVCPVLATVHGEEGLNQQAYNRCVGTRYCSNNCPYKVRRFNWFDYAHDDQLENMSLNPDVTVRSRGVMEKCTFCVQRIQEQKAVAAREGGRPLQRDEIQTACMQVCPVDAIIFGDSNDKQSAVSKQAASPRAYRALAELNVQPSVSYLRDVRDREPDAKHGHAAEGGTHHD